MIRTLKNFTSGSINSTVKRSLYLSQQVFSEKTGGFLDNLFGGARVEKATQAHSVLLADQQLLYDLTLHTVKPKYAEEYENACVTLIPKILESNKNLQLSGSWRSEIGEGDQYVHLWRYKTYTEYSQEFVNLQKNPYYQEYKKAIAKYVNKRMNHVCLSFTFWGEPVARNEPHIYEMRTYNLKPGTLIEWGNNWSRGIRNRMDFRVAGMFTQIGHLYTVHHIWACKNLNDRKASRENMWNKPGWDECVAYTVPLIRKMESKIMSALPISPTK